jgi:hypothetical protein
MGEGDCYGVVTVFCVRHIDVNNSFKKAKCLYRLITPAIVYDGDMESLVSGNANTPDELGNYMRRGHQVDIVTLPLLKGDHHPGECFAGHGLPVPALADIKILAVFTSQVTMGHKDGAGSVRPDKRRFLAKMRSEAGYLRQETCPAKAPFIFEAVNPALPGADRAISQECVCTVNSFFEFTRFIQRNV